MSANTGQDCRLCKLPVFKGGEVLLNKQPFHPGCAVVVAKERKHGRNTDSSRRGDKGHEAGVISRADPARN